MATGIGSSSSSGGNINNIIKSGELTTQEN
jgi:hypothetical protein